MALLPIAGGAPQKLRGHTTASRNLAWTRDGRALVVHASTYDLALQPLDGGPRQPLTDFKEGPLEAFALSPDGRRIVYNRIFRTRQLVLLERAE